ncbi:hypothetical protein GCM10008018_58650 [Paenibacillus marchantiophytorum]|uniref:RNA polymerase sigma-70 region 2 domain-containing protein n=1 Tax=Paenibacillus marchantiophytorum TaxID=1619310 RepID=A0ABQ1FBX9_9BACL|nr:RNA polymerase sigma factor [Paenibacillus marchantiophytorum]GGA04985.1 hypothetical protein GCM10008018_58650 [Paenibacillus marchantiophytorum]
MENNSLLRTDKELAELYQRHVDQVYRLCYIYLKNPVDAEDAVQSVFLKLIKSRMVFNDHEHEKAWLIVTTRNYCKDVKTVIPGSWETAFKLDFKEYSNLYQIDHNITMFGYEAL